MTPGAKSLGMTQRKRQLTPKQRAFADAVASGANPSEAYRIAGYSCKRMSAASIAKEAQRLLCHPHISPIIEEAREEAAEAARWTLAKATERMAFLNDQALDQVRRNGIMPGSPAWRALMESADRLNRYTGVDREIEAAGQERGAGLVVTDTAALVPGCYADAWRDIMAHGHSEYIGESGRGSLKSTVLLSLAPIMLMLKDPHLCAVAFRRVHNTLRDSIFASLVSAIRRLGVEGEFTWGVSPMEIRRPSTGQWVKFRGLDDEEKAKSLQTDDPELYIGIGIWEEFDQQRGERAVRRVEQTIKRGQAPLFWTFRAFNTPADPDHWAHAYAARQEENGEALVLRQTYLDMPPEFLGTEFLADAERLRAVSEEAYRNEYLGEAVGLTGRVFSNVEAAELTPADVAGLKWVRRGIDWGFEGDPFVFLSVGYDRKRAVLYVFDELFNTHTLDADNVAEAKLMMAERDEEGQPILDAEGAPAFRRGKPDNEVRADAAGAKDRATWRHLGVNVMGASKAVPVADGIRWLAKRAAIVIDRKRCPLAYQEFTRYRALEDGEGRFLGYPDKDNHAIDAVRYAAFDLIADPDIP